MGRADLVANRNPESEIRNPLTVRLWNQPFPQAQQLLCEVPRTCSVQISKRGVKEIMSKDSLVRVPALCHYRCADLAQPDSVTPTGTD